MDNLGLPEAVVHMFKRQSQEEGLELDWHIGGSGAKVELKLVWRPVGGPRRDDNINRRKHKGPGNLRRDYMRMKQMVVDFNSVAVGTDDMTETTSVCESGGGHSHDICQNTAPIRTPVHNKVKDPGEVLHFKSKSCVKRRANGTGVRTRQMALNDEIQSMRAEDDIFCQSDSYTCNISTVTCEM